LDICDFANQIAAIIPVDEGTKLCEPFQSASLVTAVDQLLPIKWIVPHRKRSSDAWISIERWVVTQLGIMSKCGDGVETQPVDTSVEPKTNFTKHGVDNFLIVPVQVRLAAQIMVKIILSATSI